MPVVIEYDDLSATLRQVGRSVEVVSRDGRSLGVFIPWNRPDPKAGISDKELRRRENDHGGKWYTAAEVEAKLREWRGLK